jgi:hypothetical protein
LMQTSRRFFPSRIAARSAVLMVAVSCAAFGQKASNSPTVTHAGPHPVITVESPKPASHKSHKKDPPGEVVQLRYRIVPSTSGVTSARIEIWDRPDLLVTIPVRVAKTGEVTWVDTSAPSPTRLEFLLVDPATPNSCFDTCAGGEPAIDPVIVAGDVPPSFRVDPIRVPAGAETMTLDLDGRFLSQSTRVLLAEQTTKKEIWKAWEFLPTEFIGVTKLRVTVPWSYLASARRLVLWPFNLDEVDAAQANGLPLNGTEQKTPAGGGHQAILYVANSASPALSGVQPAQLPADTSEAVVVLHGKGFTRSSVVVVGLDPLGDESSRSSPLVLTPKFVSAEELDIRIVSSQLRFPNAALARRGPIRVWVRNAAIGIQISEPRDIQILPSRQLPPAPPPGAILTISPSPLPLMNAKGPAAVEVTVTGRNFRPNNSVIASADQEEQVKLPTQFVSPEELRVSVPRPLWREHRVSYRFVIVTAQGERATELYEDEDAPESEPE